MGRNSNYKRNSLGRRREAPPEFGARHVIEMDDSVVDFFGDVDHAWAGLLPECEITEVGGRTHYRSQYRLYDDRDRLGVTVMEKRLSAEHARHKRIKWNPNDAGRLRGHIENQIGRLELANTIDMTNGQFDVELTTVARVGNPGGKLGERKIAAIVNQASPVAELMVLENEIVAGGLGVNLRGFQYPYEDYIPHLTIGRVFKEVGHGRLDECVEATQALLPITVKANPLTFYAHQEL